MKTGTTYNLTDHLLDQLRTQILRVSNALTITACSLSVENIEDVKETLATARTILQRNENSLTETQKQIDKHGAV